MSDVELADDFVLGCIENHAQLIRFVKRKEMTSQEAAKMAVDHADALNFAFAERIVELKSELSEN